MSNDSSYLSRILIIPCTGNDDSTSFTDYSTLANTVTAFGNAKIGHDSDGQYATFDGSSDYLLCATNSAYTLMNQFFLEILFKTTQTLQYACLISKDTGGFPSGAWTLLLNGSGTGSVQMWSGDYSGNTPMIQALTANVCDGNLHCIGVYLYNGTMALYVDGVQAATATWEGSISALSQPIAIARQVGYSRDFSGKIYGVRIATGSAVGSISHAVPALPLPTRGPQCVLSGPSAKFTDGSIATKVAAFLSGTKVLAGEATPDPVTGEFSIIALNQDSANFDVAIYRDGYRPLIHGPIYATAR